MIAKVVNAKTGIFNLQAKNQAKPRAWQYVDKCM
jgi:hypothetical protein